MRWYRAIGDGTVIATPWAAVGVACAALLVAWTLPDPMPVEVDLPRALAVVLMTPAYGFVIAAVCFVWFAFTARLLGSPTSMRRVFEGVTAAWAAPLVVRLLAWVALLLADLYTSAPWDVLRDVQQVVHTGTHIWLVIGTAIALGQTARLTIPRIVITLICPVALGIALTSALLSVAHV